MTAIILAAGFSRRFGGKKLLMEIEQKPMINHVVDAVLSMGFDDTLLVYHDDEVKNAIGIRNIKCVFNAAAAEGLSTSVRCGLLESDPTSDYVFFTGDQPFIDEDAVKKLLAAFSEGKGSIIVPLYEGRKGNPVIFSSIWRDKLMTITGDVGGRQIIEANIEQVCFVDICNSKAGMDIDTWEEYAAARSKELNINDR